MNKTVRTAGAALLAVALAGAAAACSSSKSDSGSAKWSKADTASAGGGMDALVAAAKQEGKLNVITLPRAWANYGKIMDDFSAKYGIKITDDNPEGSSGDEIKAIQSEKGQDRAPDVVDIGNSYALADGNLFSP